MRRPPLKHIVSWDDAAAPRLEAQFGGHVTFRGGGYFFAPARSTLLAM